MNAIIDIITLTLYQRSFSIGFLLLLDAVHWFVLLQLIKD